MTPMEPHRYLRAWKVVVGIRVTAEQHGQETFDAVERYRCGHGLTDTQWQLILQLAKQRSQNAVVQQPQSGGVRRPQSGGTIDAGLSRERSCSRCGKRIEQIRIDVFPATAICGRCAQFVNGGPPTVAREDPGFSGTREQWIRGRSQYDG